MVGVWNRSRDDGWPKIVFS